MGKKKRSVQPNNMEKGESSTAISMVPNSQSGEGKSVAPSSEPLMVDTVHPYGGPVSAADRENLRLGNPYLRAGMGLTSNGTVTQDPIPPITSPMALLEMGKVLRLEFNLMMLGRKRMMRIGLFSGVKLTAKGQPLTFVW